MPKPGHNRRTVLQGVGIMTLSSGSFALPSAAAAAPASPGYALAEAGGDQLAAPGGVISIKVDPTRGSKDMDIGTLRIDAGAGIRTHMHASMDEFFYVLEGRGTFVLDGVPHALEKGTTLFIPRGTWHGLENPDSAFAAVWGVSPSGLAGFFRELATPVGAPLKTITLEQRNAIAKKYDTVYR